MVDLLLEEDTALVGLTTVKAIASGRGGRVVRTHAANVAILSILLGRQAKLGRGALAEIGLAALLHDVGLDATGDSGMHGLHGAECVLQLGPFESVVRPALVALVHHASTDDIGATTTGDRDVVTAIVKIADAYDTLTAHGGRPDAVLQFLLQQAGRQLDAALVKLFAQAIGAYPPGCAVRLTSGEIGVVLRAGRQPSAQDRPLVRLLRDANGRAVTGISTVDLAARTPEGYPRTIACAVEPQQFGIAAPAVFLGAV
jgi:hypothetical protein